MLWCAVAVAAAGEGVPVQLVLRERGNGVPVRGATVVVEGVARVSDADGAVRFDHAPGSVLVAVDSADFAPAGISLDVGATGVTEVVWLERIGRTDEVTVYGERDTEAVDREVLSIEELRRVPGTFGDPVRALQTLPSVARPRSVEGALVVRGAEAVNTATYIDGVEVPFLFHLLAGKSVVNPSLLDRVDFYPGGLPVAYGDVAQAVVDARTVDGPIEGGGVHGDAHVDVMEVGVSARVPVPRGFDLQLAGRASWLSTVVRSGQLGWYAILDAKGDEYRPEGLRVPYSDGYARLGHAAGPNGRVSLTWFGADDGVHRIPERIDDDRDGRWDPLPEPGPREVDFTDLLENRFGRVVLAWATETDAVRQRTSIAAGGDHQRNLIQGLGVFAATPQDVDQHTRLAWLSHADRFAATRKLALAIGVDARVRDASLQQLGIGTGGEHVGPVVEDRQLWLGPYAGLEVEAGPVWLAAGVREAIHQIDDRLLTSTEPRLSARVALSDHVCARGFAGALSQAPTADRYALDDAPVRLTRSRQVGAGIEADAGGAWTVSADAYRSWFSDLVVARQVPVLAALPDQIYGIEQSIAFDPRFTITTGSAYGAELLVRRRPTGAWFGWVGVAVGHSVRWLEGEPVPSDYDTPIDATVVLARDLGRKWGASSRLHVGAGQPFTPLTGVYVSSAELYVPYEGDPNAGRLPPFFQLDLRIDKTWTARRSEWTAYLDVYNATSYPNPVVSAYDWNFSERETLAWVPILPTLGASVSF